MCNATAEFCIDREALPDDGFGFRGPARFEQHSAQKVQRRAIVGLVPDQGAASRLRGVETASLPVGIGLLE